METQWLTKYCTGKIQLLSPSVTTLTYIQEGYLRADTDIPNERALMNAYYRAECNSLRKVYAQTHKCPVGPMYFFKSEMFTIEDTYQGCQSHQTAVEKYRRQLEAKRQ